MANPTAKQPRTRPPEERRRQLLEAAKRLFLEKGVDNTSVEDITSTAMVSKGSFYLHFASRTDVIEALRTDFVENLFASVKADVDREEEGDWKARLMVWVTACATGYLKTTRLHRLLFTAAPSPSRSGLTQNILIDDLRELLVAGCRSHVWELTDPAFTAVFLFNALHAVVDHRNQIETPNEREALLSNIRLHTERLMCTRS